MRQKQMIAAQALAAILLASLTAPAVAYHLARAIKLSGTEGWDYLTFDATRAWLCERGRHLQHRCVDLISLARLAEIKTTGENPDAILYEPTTHRLFAFNGRGRNVTVVDTPKNEVVGTIELDAKPEFAVHDGAGRVFVNLEDRNSLAAIDARTLAVTARWPLVGCEEPTGLAIDRKHHRLFAACSNRVMVIVDSTTGRNIARVPIGAGVDGAAFDATKQLAFASGGDGTLTVIREETPDKFTVAETVATKPGARTLTLDEHTHRIFLATAQRAPAAPATPAQPHPRPSIVPGTFEVLVVEP